MDAHTYATSFMADLRIADAMRDRSQQTDPGISSVGVCKRQWQLHTTDAPHTDAPARLDAGIGTALHVWVGGVRAEAGLVTEREVWLDIAGRRLRGHVDEINLQEPSVTDYKFPDGLALVRRVPSNAQQRFQRHLYGAAVLAALTPAERHHVAHDLVVRNIYIDRSGKDERPHVEQESFDPEVVALAEQWIEQVDADTAAGRVAEQEKDVWWCERYCPFFTGCRSGFTPDEEITDPAVINFVELAYAARTAAKDGKNLADELKEELRGVAGVTPSGIRVRWSSNGALTLTQAAAVAVPA